MVLEGGGDWRRGGSLVARGEFPSTPNRARITRSATSPFGNWHSSSARIGAGHWRWAKKPPNHKNLATSAELGRYLMANTIHNHGGSVGFLAILAAASLSMAPSCRKPEQAEPLRAEPSSIAAPETTQAMDAAASLPDASPALTAHPIFNECVLHAGDVNVRRRQPLLPDGGLGPAVVISACAFNAECVRAKGKSSPGDGFVHMECSGRDCFCAYQSANTGNREVSVSFAIEEACDSAAKAESNFVQRCLSGMRFQIDPNARR